MGNPAELRLYTSLAEWWPLLSPPEDYREEAAVYAGYLKRFGDEPCDTLVEFGSGGGNNASHMKSRFTITLVDPSPGMLAVSTRLNAECEHVPGDMRSVRLGRVFDRVFIHDAICYMTTLDDLRAAVETAFVHCRPGGCALFAPDFIRENFRAGIDHGGADGDGRALRYLEWVAPAAEHDNTYLVDYACMLKYEDGSVRVEHDRHVEGLFPRAEWLHVLTEAGFQPEALPFRHSDVGYPAELFVGAKAR